MVFPATACGYQIARAPEACLPRVVAGFALTLSEGGKPKKVALVALMRKLIVLLNHLLKNPQFKLA